MKPSDPKSFTISRAGPREYLLSDAAGQVVRCDLNPKRLANWAFDNGAGSVRHEYDLRLAEQEAIQ